MLSGKRLPKANAGPNFASRLLKKEPQGFAIDATLGHTLGPAYVGGPYGGTVSVKDPTLANNLYNVPLDSSNLTQSGTSPKMVLWGSSPYVRWTPHNIQFQSQTFDNASWSKANCTVTANATTAPDGTSTADKLVEASDTGQLHNAVQTQTVLANTVYNVSVYAKAAERTRIALGADDNGGDGVYCGFDLSGVQIAYDEGTTFGAGFSYITGSASATDIGSGWVRCEFSFQTTGTTAGHRVYLDSGSGTAANAATYNGNGSSGAYVWGAQLSRGYNPLPYLVTTTAARIGIPQEFDTAASKYGILIEPAATNLCLYSDDFTNAAWTKSNMTAAKTATGPDEAANSASTLTATAGNATVLQAITDASAARITSFWVKRRTGSGNIDLTQDNGATWQTMTVTAGWTRVNLTAATLANPTVGIRIVTSGDAVDVYGFQHETGSIATSTIPTLGSTTTRAADIPKALVSTFPWSDTNGSIYIKYKPKVVSSGSRYAWQAYKDANNHISLLGITANPTLENTQASSQDVAIDAGTLVANTSTRIASAFKGNDFDVSQDGAAAISDATATLTTGYTDLYIGTKGSATTEELNGYIYQLLYVPYQRQTASGDLATWKNTA